MPKAGDDTVIGSARAEAPKREVAKAPQPVEPEKVITSQQEQLARSEENERKRRKA